MKKFHTRPGGALQRLCAPPGRNLHGAFTLALLEGLTGRRLYEKSSKTPLPADSNGDGVLHLAELDAYVTNRVKELTQGSQHPVTSRKNVPSFPVALTDNPSTSSSQGPSPASQADFSRNPDGFGKNLD